MHCKHFGVCGGCTLPGVPYAEQLARKRDRLSRLLGLDIPPLIPSPAESRFRNKVAFVFGPEGQGRGLVMGHYARGSKQIVRVDECPVHSDRGNRIAFALRDRLVQARIYGVGAQRNGLVRHVIIRTTEDDRQAVAMLVVTRNDKSLRKPIKSLLASDDRPDGFFINIHDKPGPYMVGPETIRIDGHSHVKEDSLGTSFLVSPTAFFQTNVGAARELVKLVMDGVLDDPKGSSLQTSSLQTSSLQTSSLQTSSLQTSSLRTSSHILDLYSGSGLFTLPLAKAGAAVTAVEENRQAVNDAAANLRVNRIPDGQVRLICSRVEDALPRVSKEPWNAVVLDPPRQGCPPAVLATVFERIAPARAVYVSCNPDALSKELPGILGAGYRVTGIQAVDMFPHTDHIETVLTIARG